MSHRECLIFSIVLLVGYILCIMLMRGLDNDKQTLLSVIGEMNEEIAIRDSYINDLCTAIDSDKDNFRTSCKDIIKANDYGRGK